MKNNPSAHLSNLVKYIGTREGVDKDIDNKRTDKESAPTSNQQKLITELVKSFPGIKKLFEYEDYFSNPTKANASEFISIAIEQNLDLIGKRKNYVEYIANRPRVERIGSHGLFSDGKDEIVLSQVQEQVANSKGNVWTDVISLRREDAERLGYDNAKNWSELLRSQRNIIAKAMHINPDNFIWYAAFHNESHHPHCHLICFSKNPKEAYLTNDGIETIRSTLAHVIFRQDFDHIYTEQTKARDTLKANSEKVMLEIISQIQNSVCINPVIEEHITTLAKRLRNIGGKHQYGYLKTDVKAIVNSIVDELEKDERVSALYDKWYEMRNNILRSYSDKLPNKIPLSQQKEFTSTKNMIIREADNIGNYVFEVDCEDEQETDNIIEDEADKKASPFSFYSEYHSMKKQLESDNIDKVWEAIKWFENNSSDNEWVQFTLGKIFRDDKYGVFDIEKAVKYFSMSAEQSNEFAQYALGKLYLNEDTPKNIPSAIKWLTISAEKGNRFAQYSLGKLYLQEGSMKDIPTALKWLTDSAEQGNQFAQYALGKLYLLNKDIPRDEEMALKWLTLSAEQGNTYAHFLIDNIDSFKDPYVFLAATRLLRQLSNIFNDEIYKHSSIANDKIDRKRMKQLRQKKIAQGHAENEQIQVL